MLSNSHFTYNKDEIDKEKFQRFNRIFNYSLKKKELEESKYNKTDQVDITTEVDTDWEIIDSVSKYKYWDNFNITFEENALMKTLNKETKFDTLETPSANMQESLRGCLPQLKRELKNSKRMKEMVVSLANDLDITENEAYRQLWNNPDFNNINVIEKQNKLENNPFNINSENDENLLSRYKNDKKLHSSKSSKKFSFKKEI